MSERAADALGKSLDGRDDRVLPTPMCACRIVGPLGVGSLLADPPLVHKIIGGQVFAVAYCARHRAAPEVLTALVELRVACVEAYKAGRIPAEPFVRAGNVIAKASA